MHKEQKRLNIIEKNVNSEQKGIDK